MSSTKQVTVKEAGEMLRGMEDILILTHRNPDGDTLGSAFALWAALRQLGKRARVSCPNEIHRMYQYLTVIHDEEADDFSPKTIVTVDAATISQLGTNGSLGENAELAIDHHSSHTEYARHTLLDRHSASCAELVYRVILELGVTINEYIASALYTGVSTDTGCYRFQNTTANSHEVTANLIQCGIDLSFLNKVLFETKSRAYIALQRMAIDSLEYYYHDKIAMMTITNEMMKLSGAVEDDLNGITAIPRSIEGVEAGLTFREQQNGNVKCSVRTTSLVDASKICEQFGGGGHHGAAGFECSGEMVDIKTLVVRAVISQLKGKE